MKNHFYSKTKLDAPTYQIYFILELHSTCFGRSFSPSSAVQDCTYSNRHMSNRYCCLLASGNNTVHVSDGLSVHHQQFKTVHTATGTCQTDTAVCLLAGITLYMFRTVFPSIINSSRLYIQQQAFVKQILLSAC